MRCVFDTVILVRGLINPYSLCGRLVFDYPGFYELIVSSAVVAEYLSVVNRPELVRKYQSVETRNLPTILDFVAKATVVQPMAIPAVGRDPEDDKFLAAAQAGGARFIVSEDLDLLDLGSYGKTAIISAEAFLRILDAAENE